MKKLNIKESMEAIVSEISNEPLLTSVRKIKNEKIQPNIGVYCEINKLLETEKVMIIGSNLYNKIENDGLILNMKTKRLDLKTDCLKIYSKVKEMFIELGECVESIFPENSYNEKVLLDF